MRAAKLLYFTSHLSTTRCTAHHRSAHIDRCQIARVLRAVRLSHYTAAPLSPLCHHVTEPKPAPRASSPHHTSQGSHFTRSKPAPRASSPQSRRGTHTRSAATRDAPRPITPSIPRPKSHRPVHPTSYHPLPSHASRPKGQGARHLSCSHTSISLGAMPRSRSHSSDPVGRDAEIAQVLRAVAKGACARGLIEIRKVLAHHSRAAPALCLPEDL